LTKNFDWNAVLVEASRSSFEKLKEAHRNSKNSILINKFVEFEGENKLDSILSETPIPRNFDFLSIDIDGNDYYIWESLVQYRPKVVLIEFNPTIPDSVDFVQPKNMSVTQGSSVSAIARLGKKKDYELVAVTDSNAVFVDKKYFELFDIKDNSISTLREVHKYETVFFQLYDGTIVIQGLDKLFWHELNLNDTIQIIPKMFRKYPGNLHGLRKFFYKVFKFFRKRL
jgi:hypothetical protein